MKVSSRKKHYTITEAARTLNISRVAVHEAIRKGRLEAEWGAIAPPPKGWWVLAKSLDDYRVSLSHQERGKKLDLA